MAIPAPYIDVRPLAWRGGKARQTHRAIPEEVAVALTFDGSAYAVMMATPLDLIDFATGFAITEDVIGGPDDIESLEILEVEGGIEARMWLKPLASQRRRATRRSILGPTGCGLCGTESIAQALKPVRCISSRFTVTPREIMSAMSALQSRQSLNAKTRAVHAAALHAGGEIIVREDAGRHNALDKVIGAASRLSNSTDDGIVLLTSRVSVELVQKTARLGAPVIAAISAPTALAVRVAESAGITLAAVLRGDGFEVFTYPERILMEKAPADGS
ncbi:MAG: formate dehydrogenase accessory sulfurtransferase FdhD [Rhodomicrobium sp.]